MWPLKDKLERELTEKERKEEVRFLRGASDDNET